MKPKKNVAKVAKVAKAKKPAIDFDLERELEMFDGEPDAIKVLRHYIGKRTKPQFTKSVVKILAYLWEDERDSFISHPDRDHIFMELCRVLIELGGPAFWRYN